MACRHLHVRKFNSGTEYGDLWACLECPDVFLSLPTPDSDDIEGVDVFHTEERTQDVYSYDIR